LVTMSALIILNPQDTSPEMLKEVNALLQQHWTCVVYSRKTAEYMNPGLLPPYVTAEEVAAAEAETVKYNEEMNACYGISCSTTNEEMARSAKTIYSYLQLMYRPGRESAFDCVKLGTLSLEDVLRTWNITSVKVCGFTDIAETVADAITAGFTVL